MNRVFKALAIAFTVVVALVSCKKEDQPKEVALTGIELNATSQTLQVGQEFQLTVTYKPENATNKPAATWASDTPAVATVDGGKVVAVAAGTAKITATVGTFKAECAVTVASAEEEILPVEGNSDWSIIGALLGANWDKDFVAAKDGDIYVVKNVKLAAADQFKFRKDKDWGVNRGAEGDVEPFKLTAGTAITVINNGKNLAAPGDGIYDIYYNAAVEQVCLVAKDGTPKWNEPEVKGLIDIDGDFSDWAEIWGHASEGYIYLALDLDKDPETGDMLWSNGPFEFVGYHYPFGGSAESPAINEKPGANTSCAPSTASTKNIFCKGAIGTDEVEIEYRIPRADLPEIPETPFIVYSWGSLGLDKVEYHVGEPQPAPEYVHDYTPSAEYLAETNLWKAVESGDAFISVTPWFADNSWSQIGDPTWKHENSEWTLTIPEGMGGSQWQGQFPINTKLTASMSKKYNFYLVLEADQDCNGVTIKLTQTDEANGTKHDDNFFFADRHDIKADEPFIYKATAVTLPKNDAHALSLFFDFGGSPIGTNIKISKIYFEEAVVLSYDDANNLWKGVDNGTDFISVTPWFANDSWSQIGDPTWKHDGNKWSLTIPEGMGGSQWQGQFPISVTIKLTQTDEANGTKHDANFYFADRHDVKADEPFVYTMKGVTLPKNDAHALSLFFDFGGSPIGTNIVISDIIFEKAE